MFIDKVSITGAVADGDFLLSPEHEFRERTYVVITFYTDDTYSTPVTPSAGTATVTATDDGFNFGSVNQGIIDVSDPAYSRPDIIGFITQLNLNLSGVVGATHFKFKAVSYE